MLERILDHRERQQIRKDRLMKRNMRYLTLFMIATLAVLAVIYVVDAVKPANATKSSTQTVSLAQKQEKQDIEKFAYIMTKPIEEVTDEDFNFVGTFEGDSCFEKNAKLPRPQMIETIEKCKGVK